MAPPPETVEFKLRIPFGGEVQEIRLDVPSEPVDRVGLLPVLQDFDNQLVEVAEAAVARQNKKISCCAGCGACCRQLVPIAEPEARFLEQVISRMTPERQAIIRQRFADAVARMDAAGLLSDLENVLSVSLGDARAQLGLRYFRQGVACPFLEDESCSIHPDRPLGCREFLVTSPAVECQSPSAENIERVPLPGELSEAFYRLGPSGQAQSPRWLPLILALRFLESSTDREPITGSAAETKLPGDQLFQRLLQK